MAWNDLNDMPWLTEHPSVGQSLALGAQAGAPIGRNLSEARRLNEERRQFDQTAPLRIQQAQSQQQLQQLAIANQMLDNQLKVDAMGDRVAMTAAQAAWGKGDTGLVPAFKTPEAFTAWETWKSGTELGKKLAMDKVQFTDSLNNLDPQGRQSVLSLMGNSPMPNSAAWSKLTEEQSRIKSASVAAAKDMEKFKSDLRISETATKTEDKPLTPEQMKLRGYAARLEFNNEAIADVEANGFDASGAGAAVWRPNFLKGENLQSYEAAKKNWVTAVLRQESGASIAPPEFKGADEQYFPQLGDTPKVVRQKRDLRNMAQENMWVEGGGRQAKEKSADSTQFQTEDAARKSGAKSGDIIEIYDPATARYRKARLK